MSQDSRFLAIRFLVVEVLSVSTADRDRGEKFEAYKCLKSLREYVLVEQHRPQIYVYTRSTVGEWIYNGYFGLEAIMVLHSLGLRVPLAHSYEGIKLAEGFGQGLGAI